MERTIWRLEQETGKGDSTLEAGIQGAIGSTGIRDHSGTIFTRRECSSWAVPKGASDASQTKPNNRRQIPTAFGRVTIPDPSDSLGDPVVERTIQQLVGTAGRLVAYRNVPGSGVTAPCGTIDDTGRVELSSEVLKKTGAAAAISENLKNLR